LNQFSVFSTLPFSFLPGNAGNLIMLSEFVFVKQNLRSDAVLNIDIGRSSNFAA